MVAEAAMAREDEVDEENCIPFEAIRVEEEVTCCDICDVEECLTSKLDGDAIGERVNSGLRLSRSLAPSSANESMPDLLFDSLKLAFRPDEEDLMSWPPSFTLILLDTRRDCCEACEK